MKSALLSVGKMLLLGVAGYVVLNRYRDIFSLDRTQYISLIILFVTCVFSSIKIGEWLAKRLPWKESLVENVTLGVIFALCGGVFVLFVL